MSNCKVQNRGGGGGGGGGWIEIEYIIMLLRRGAKYGTYNFLYLFQDLH